jgi:glc operon protein GlcG
MIVRKLAGIAALCASVAVQAQVPQYGPNVTLEQAKKIAAAAAAEGRKNSWPVAIAIVDTAGQLVYFERADDTQTGSLLIAQDKAVSAAMLRRSTKVIQDAIAQGGAGLRFLELRHVTPVEGGIPISMGGKIVGAIGVSGVNSDQDGMVAKAGADTVK